MKRTTQSTLQVTAFAVVIIAALGVLFLAQRPNPASQPAETNMSVGAPESSATISFAAFDIQLARYEDLAQQFEQESGIHVQVLSYEQIIGSNQSNPSANIRQIAEAADTFAIQLDANMISQGALLDLTPFIEADATFERDDFYPAALESMQTDGATWAVPSSLAFELIAYDKEAFDQAGVAYPEVGWTQDDFLSKAQALTQREGEEVTRWGFVQTFLHPLPFVAARVDLSNAAIPLNSTAIAGALRWYTDLALRHQITPLERLLNDQTGYNMIGSGRAAMWDIFSSNPLDESAGVVPFPSENTNGRTTPIYVAGYATSAGTQHAQESWRWLVFLSRHLSSDVNEFSALPARQSLADAIGFWDKFDPLTATAYRFALEHANTSLLDPTLSSKLREAAAAVLQGTSVEQALGVQTSLVEATAQPAAQPFVVSTPLPTSVGATAITFLHQYESLNPLPFDTLAREFNATHPDVQVRVRPNISGDPNFAASAQTSDCFVWPRGWESLDYAKLNQYVITLQPLIDADPTFPLNDFYPIALDAYRTQGDLWALPAEFKPGEVLRYNKSLFDAAGIAYPQAGWTLEDFRSAAVALTDVDREQYGFLSLGFSPSIDMLYIFAQLNGAIYFDIQSDPPQPRFDDPQTVEALQWYIDLVNLDGVDRIDGEDPQIRWPKDYDWRISAPLTEKRQALIARGQVAMWFEPFLEEYPQSIVPLPLGVNGHIRGFFEGFYISASSPYPQACWEWIKFISDHSSQFTRYAPVRHSAYAAPDFVERVGTEYVTAMQFSIEHTTLNDDGTEQLIGIQQYGPWFSDAARAAYLDQRDLATDLGEVQRMAEGYVLCLDNRDGFGNEEIQQVCAAEVDPGTASP